MQVTDNSTSRSDAIGATRKPLYGLLNLAFIFYIGAASAMGPSTNPRLLYLSLLFAICSSPVLFLRKANDRFAMYTIFCAIYFVSFGVIDVVSLLYGPADLGATGVISPPELLILLGGVAFVTGYHLCASRRKPSDFAVDDWSARTLLVVGLILWGYGTFATWYWNIRITVRAGDTRNDTGELVTTILMLGRYVQPLGLLVIAYAYTVYKTKLLTAIMVCLALYQVYLGFISDTKGGAMLGGILVIVTGFLVNGKIPKMWVIAGILFIALAFPIFQAHRTFVVGERGLTNANSADNLGRVLELSLDGTKRAENERSESFFHRSSVKSAVEMIVNRTGQSVPFQNGHTLFPMVTAFIPRLIWPDKPDVQTGQLVNTEFHVTGDNVTYISPSHLGEMYWNFGWGGAIAGMLILGLIFGWTNVLCDLSTRASVTRLLVLGITVLELGVRFEASVATEYAVWMRSIVAILLLQWLFATKRVAASPSLSPSEPNEPTQVPHVGVPAFPNLLR